MSEGTASERPRPALSRWTTARWVPLILLAAWWFLEITSSMNVALSQFPLVGEAPPAVRAWTLAASVLAQFGEALPWALPLVVSAAATLRSVLSRRVVACAVLVTCALAANWLRPAADLAADHRMPGSIPHAPPQDFRAYTSPELLRIHRADGVTEQQVAMAHGLVGQRVASVVAAAVLLVPLVALRRRVALRWFVAPGLTAVMLGMNLGAFSVFGPRLASPAAPMIWSVGPAIVVSILLWAALRRADGVDEGAIVDSGAQQVAGI